MHQAHHKAVTPLELLLASLKFKTAALRLCLRRSEGQA